MKLELKHLASYLPYKLKYKFESEDFFHEVIGLDITNNPIKLISPFGDFGSCEINVGKPILFPLSQFVKFTFSEEVEECLLNYSADFILNQTNRLPYFIIQEFLSNKIDVFGLIEAGLAEPVTEDFNPYK